MIITKEVYCPAFIEGEKINYVSPFNCLLKPCKIDFIQHQKYCNKTGATVKQKVDNRERMMYSNYKCWSKNSRILFCLGRWGKLVLLHRDHKCSEKL